LSLDAPLVPGLEYRRADAVYAARHEMVHSLTDVLARRTRALLLDRDAAVAAAPDVAALIAPEMHWTADEVAEQVDAFRAVAAMENEAQHA
jgi:glycerol-3-phosphate dehydrogenase